jgi:large subunit ribosomal protein L35
MYFDGQVDVVTKCDVQAPKEKCSASSVKISAHRTSTFFENVHPIYITTTMSTCQKAARPLVRCLREPHSTYLSARTIRGFTSSTRKNEEAAAVETKVPRVWDPETVTARKGERALMRGGVMPIGSRRRRAALQTSDNVPFEQLPYQCFQEALKLLRADRKDKLELIKTERLRISNLKAQDVANIKGGQVHKDRRLASMERHLEYLKIQADINDPLIKKRFEDGDGLSNESRIPATLANYNFQAI